MIRPPAEFARSLSGGCDNLFEDWRRVVDDVVTTRSQIATASSWREWFALGECLGGFARGHANQSEARKAASDPIKSYESKVLSLELIDHPEHFNVNMDLSVTGELRGW